jgi:hypothetical protein
LHRFHKKNTLQKPNEKNNTKLLTEIGKVIFYFEIYKSQTVNQLKGFLISENINYTVLTVL